MTTIHDRPRDPGLDLLRTLAIVTVMLYHIASHGFDLPLIGRHGWIGVDLFFVLSGYLIGWQVLRQYAHGKPSMPRPGAAWMACWLACCWRRWMLFGRGGGIGCCARVRCCW